jgi:hypothetical protein
MARWERGFRTPSSPVGGLLHLACWSVLLAGGSVSAQAPLRCDLKLESTPGAAAGAACLDLVAMQNGGAPIVTANNVTRISVDGFTLCKNAFQITKPAGADIIFIYDNSGSMWAHYAKIDSAKKDTSYYHAQSCGGGGGGGGLTGTPLTYTTLIGPRTIQLLPSTVTCGEYAGDPFFARGKAIEQAIDYLALNSPNSTAGAIAFERDTNHTQKPLLLSVPGNAGAVKASIKLDSVPSTNYMPPLRLATTWLTDTAITSTAKQAIVFLSDGQPNDGAQLTTWLAANKGIPIYTIALGDSAATFTRMEEMSTSTGGRFYRVAPENIAGMNQVMQEIVKAITVVDMPTSIQVTNTTFTPPMVSKSVRLTRSADSSIVPVMDSIVALKTGLNSLKVKVTLSENEVRTYDVKVQADGPAAAASGQSLSCYPQPVLTLLNQAGGLDSAYTAAITPYNVRLTRATSDLQQVIVVATSADTTRPGWGDEESLNLPQASASGGTTVNQKNNVQLNGSAATAPKGDGILQAAPGPGGSVTLVWKHPRDEREKATYRLPGKSIGSATGFIDVVRATDAPRGLPLPTAITDPIVIRGGATLVKTPTGATLKHKGDLSNPDKLSDDFLDPNHTPTFVFNTAAPFSYTVSIYDHLGQFLNSQSGAVDSAKWDKMRGGADSLACAFSIVPVSKNGQRFGTGAYILRATLTTRATVRQDQGKPMRVTPATRVFTNRFGYVR